MQRERVYLDYAATTPVDARVMQAMQPYFRERFGNPSSVHTFGQEAEAGLEQARARIAGILRASSEEIVFTSGATESNNLALRGLALATRRHRGATRLVTSPVEHDSVRTTVEDLVQNHGFELHELPVDVNGLVDPAKMQECLTDGTALVSVVYGNNEIGSINPIDEIGRRCRAAGVPFHVDAVQAGHLTLQVDTLNVDLMSISGHKLYAPKGIGALYVRKGLDLAPVLTGGAQEFGRRAGTVNTAFAVALAAALDIAQQEREALNRQWRELRDLLIEGVLARNPDARLTGHRQRRLPHHASFAFLGVDSNELLAALDLQGFACSSGSACKTGVHEPSKILQAIGLGPEWASGSLRVTLGRSTIQEQIERLLDVLPPLVERLRSVEVARR
jgi:cysteine desulfurase